MKVTQLLKHLGLRPFVIGCIAAVLWPSLYGGQPVVPDTVRQAADYAAAGQWTAALTALDAADTSADPRTEALKGLLREHQALADRRQQQRQALFDEKRLALDSLDPNTLNAESTLLDAMALFKSAWDNATTPERDRLLAGSVFGMLRQAAYERFCADDQAGRWDTAWTRWMQWLVEFSPQSFKEASDDLQQRRLIANALRQNPCDITAVPYSQVTHRTAAQVFTVLESRYVEPPPFDRLTQHGLRRLALLTTVLDNPTITFAVERDPNGVAAWADHIASLQTAAPPTDSAGMAALLETLTAVNHITLKLPEGVILAQFTEAALTALDPYTEAVWPEGLGLFEKNITGQFGGIGIRIKRDGENLVIVSVIPDTPAAGTLLAADDIILAVDGQPTNDLPTNCAVSLISGPVGTAVSLTVRRPGVEKVQIVTVLRQRIVLPTVEGAHRAENNGGEGHWDYFLDAEHRIGYLQLNGFTDKTAQQARGVLEQLEQKKVAGLIIDVRGNGGGLLTEATSLANLFISDGVLLTSRGRGDSQTVQRAKSNAVTRGYPLVILINEASASASEIVAGVLAVRKPGQTTLIGQRTYGKGTVQEIADLGPDGGRLKLTTAYYHLPDGQPVPNRYKLQSEGRTDWGIPPHIDIPLYAFEVAEISRLQLERRKQLMAKDAPDTRDDKTDSLVRQMLAADPQLAAALIVLKAKLIAEQ
ncbi:MAG: S41 family peptidase [Phycisphaerae bacterium]|nr:S41 family peptidase [Phycisphaerae bacterium]